MTIHITQSIPIVVAVGGAIMYFFVPGKWAELGRMAFGAGLLALLL